MKRAGPSPTRHISALLTPLRTPTIISGAPVRGPISISGSITPLICARNRTESYDANGNMTRESTLPGGQSSASQLPNLTTIGDVRRADQAFGFINEVEDDDQNEYIRTFSWDAENRLKTVLTSNGRSVRYLYDADGIRTTKYAGDGAYTEGLSGETLYYNQWWTETEDSGSFRRAKHIYVGQERIVTRLSNPAIGGSPYEDVNTYYYHPDHLGSAHSITDSEGNPYERIEYTPYGEMWIEIQEDDATESYNYIPFRFTGKEYDQETGLYYYGARYLDPKTSRWVSGDPAGFGLMNPMGRDGSPRPGFNLIESINWYSYAGNNPVLYVDPLGMQLITPRDFFSFYANYVNARPSRDPLFALLIGNPVAVEAFRQSAIHTLDNAVMVTETVSDGATVVAVGALCFGQPEVSAVAGAVSVTADIATAALKGTRALLENDKQSYGDFVSTVAGLGVQVLAGVVTKGMNSKVRVTIGKNNQYYKIGRRGALSNYEGFRQKLMQDLSEVLAPEMAGRVVQEIVDLVQGTRDE